MDRVELNCFVRAGGHDVYRAHINGESDVWTLQWSDGLEEHREQFDCLSVALARLAVLQRCCENDWHSSFQHDAGDFAGIARKWLNTQVTGF